jgi:hypothetical protein
MRSTLTKRLERLERCLRPDNLMVSAPSSWSDLSDNELESLIARWRAGENFGDPIDPEMTGLAGIYQQMDSMRSDLSITERKRAHVRVVRYGKGPYGLAGE